MFHGFNLKLDNVNLLGSTTKYSEELKENKDRMMRSIKSLIESDGSIVADNINDDWFSGLDEYHVFISHSHKDLKLAEQLANWLYEKFELKSFIDSHVWGYANDLMQELNNEYSKIPNSTTYYLEKTNNVASHVHMMLSSALDTMIDKSECLIFLNTENAINNMNVNGENTQNYTFSPWIMSELKTSKLIKRKQDFSRKSMRSKSANFGLESLSESADLKIRHQAPLGHLISLNEENLHSWDDMSKKFIVDESPYDALTVLYNERAAEEYVLEKNKVHEVVADGY